MALALLYQTVNGQPTNQTDTELTSTWRIVQIRARVAGHLMTQNYTEGAVVKAGDQLFQVDPRPFQAALDQAEARLLGGGWNLADAQWTEQTR